MNHHAPNYEVIDHTADLGMVVKGADARDLFTNAAYAMLDLMIEGDMGGKGVKRQITIEGEDYSDLMVRWLGEILYLFAADRLLVHRIAIKSMSPTRLQAVLSMPRFNGARHEILREIKAVTYHQITVDETPDGWKARVIFDI
jgi:SHS2 domain-containing protein